ncbi:MAG: PaaX family transcriptional regulator C-terminal domain-containing protein [Alcanivoracaceae bacterium]|nr:PaaX family transcriptional regulator C-terminal domain-containing protein [Alcanivoracaceae bacterium]
MKLRPRRLILNLMLTDLERPLGIRDAITAGALFGIRESSVRVAMTRLSADGLIAACDRGVYVLGPAARDLAADVSRWRSRLKRLRRWRGTWVAVYCAALGRSDRKALRARERVLALTGFRELDNGLFIRPDNLAGGVAAMRERLYGLGLESAALVAGLHELDADSQARAMGLWPAAQLNRDYRRTRSRLQAWLSQCDALEPEVAAREAFVMGDAAIRQMVFDPLLPDALVDGEARQAFFDTLLAYDEAGQGIWRRLYQHASDHRQASSGAALH